LAGVIGVIGVISKVATYSKSMLQMMPDFAERKIFNSGLVTAKFLTYKTPVADNSKKAEASIA
jgi:hypothetical protein